MRGIGEMATGEPNAEWELLVVQFLVPKYDRSGDPYPRSIHVSLRRDLEERFGGWSSLGDAPLPGAWRNPESGEIEYDDSWRYEVGIPPARIREFDDYLADLARRIGQKAIWRVAYAGGEGKAIPAGRPRGRPR
jgi:hypothetical protein